MKAVRIHQYGGVDVLNVEEAPRPEPGPGEVLIRVHASSVNPFDAAVRAGYLHSYFNYSLPLIIGTDVSGVVEELGPGVENLAVGDAVYTRAGVFRDGGNAEYAKAFAADVAYKPQSLDHIHSAALPHATLAAWHGLFDLAAMSEGQTVLIHAAAGGVGHLAVQLAHLHGIKVIGTASGNISLLHELNVEQAIDYTQVAFDEVVKDVDVVLDLVGGETQERSWKVLKPGGILVTALGVPPSPETAAAHGVRAAQIATNPPMGPTLTELAKLVDEGKIKPTVSTVLPLDEIRKAHELIEGRHNRGKLVLQVV